VGYKDAEKRKEYSRKYYAKNKEKRKEYDRKWRKENPEKRRKYAKEWSNKNPEKRRKISREWLTKLRKEALDKLGGECINCGETRPYVLQIDHVIEFRIRDKKRSDQDRGYMLHLHIVNDTLDENEELQVLCANCHLEKTNLKGPWKPPWD